MGSMRALLPEPLERGGYRGTKAAGDCASRIRSEHQQSKALITKSEIRTDKVEEVEAILQTDYGWHSRVAVERDPFHLTMRSWTGDKVIFGDRQTSVAQAIRARIPTSMVFLHLPRDHAYRYRVGKRSLTATTDRAVLLPANHEYTLRSKPGYAIALAVNTDRLIEELGERWPGRRGHVIVKPMEISLTKPHQLQLLSLMRRWTHLAEIRTSGQEHEVTARAFEFESEIVSWLSENIILNEGCRPLSPRNKLRIARVVSWIDRNLAEPISVTDLEKISGIGSRGLNKIFVADRGMTAMDLVLSRRLEAAHRSLRTGGEHTLVSKIALDCGFTHLGRFAQKYHEAFGERPFETLEKASFVP